MSGPVNFKPKVTDKTDGTYAIAYETKVNGAYKLSIMLKINFKDYHIKGSPFKVSVQYGAIYKGFGYGSGLVTATAGKRTAFRIQFQDQFRNNRTSPALVCVQGMKPASSIYIGNGVTEVVWSSRRAQDGFRFILSVVDNRDKSKTCANAQGELVYSAKVSGKSGAFDVRILPSALDPSTCSARGGGKSNAVAGVESLFTVQSKDRYDNNVPQSMFPPPKKGSKDKFLKFKAVLSGPESSTFYGSKITDSLFQFYYKVKKQGRYGLKVTILGADIKGSPFAVDVSSAKTNASVSHWGPVVRGRSACSEVHD